MTLQLVSISGRPDRALSMFAVWNHDESLGEKGSAQAMTHLGYVVKVVLPAVKGRRVRTGWYSLPGAVLPFHAFADFVQSERFSYRTRHDAVDRLLRSTIYDLLS